ncbi:terminase small subunit [Leptospira johnsonii]|uniref:Terminase small subunit n=1 Tax=Leptospira johnsonii TaxID=1917820 RepID=A0A2P2D7T9_9LEPT|nr:terminase small subunit [Leptospira johnsonii]GBF40697.1 hypothetical protein LPTSP1_37150 [Leptospira johnsonii]
MTNPKQQLFIEYYIQSLNATEAYKKAYDCDDSTARANGSRLLTNADIRSQVNKALRKKMLDEEDEFRSIWEREVRDLTMARMTDYLDEEGRIDLDKIKEIRPGAIQDYTVAVSKKGDILFHTIKLHPKTKALELAGKYLALITDRVDHTTNGKDLPSVVIDNQLSREELIRLAKEAVKSASSSPET